MEIIGNCPDCEQRLAIQLGGSVTALIPESTIKNMMDDDGNGFWCQGCEEYTEPTDIKIE